MRGNTVCFFLKKSISPDRIFYRLLTTTYNYMFHCHEKSKILDFANLSFLQKSQTQTDNYTHF